MPETPKWLRPQAASEYTQLAASTLAKMRLRGDGPPFSKAGPRAVVYNRDDLDRWLAGRRQHSTSDPGEAG